MLVCFRSKHIVAAGREAALHLTVRGRPHFFLRPDMGQGLAL